jgi:hypothetical protein
MFKRDVTESKEVRTSFIYSLKHILIHEIFVIEGLLQVKP